MVRLKNRAMPALHATARASDLMQSLVQGRVAGVQPKIKYGLPTADTFPLYCNA